MTAKTKLNILISALLILAVVLICVVFACSTYTYASPTEVTVTYNSNQATSVTAQKTYEVNVLTKAEWPANLNFAAESGKYFAGWNTSANGGGTSYAAGGAFTPVADVTLYAQWTTVQAPFTARLYDNANYATSPYTELTEGGGIGNGWDLDANPTRYLVISADFSGCNGGTISITLPTGMALYDSNYTKMSTKHPNMLNEPTFVSYDEDSGIAGLQQGTGTYSNARTGTLTYTFSAAATNEEPLYIPVTFDRHVWNKDAGLVNLTGDNAPITVTLTPNSGTTSTKTMSKVLSSTGSGPNIYQDYWPKKVPIDADRVSMSYTSIRSANTYWRTLTVEYTLPHDAQNNYATYVGETMAGDTSLNTYALVYTTSGYTVNTSDPTKLIYTWTNINIAGNGILYVSPALTFPSTKFSDGENLTFNVKLTGESYSGEVITKTRNCAMEAMTIKPNVEIASQSISVYQSNYPDDVYNILGSLSLRNTGLADSDKIHVTFNFDTNNVIGSGNHSIEVAAFSLPQAQLASNVSFSAMCTLVDENNENRIDFEMQNLYKTASNQYGYLLLASDVVSAYNTANPDSAVTGNWYLKTVTYEIPKIPTGLESTLFYRTAQLGFDSAIPSGGNFYGRIINSASNSIMVKEWDATLNDWSATTKTAISNPSKASVSTPTLYVGNVTLNSTATSKTITAGDTVTLSTELWMHNYPYGTTQYALNPVLYFVAPVGVSIPDGGVSAVWSDGSQDAITTILTSRLLSSGDTVYKIEFNGTAAFGGPAIVNGILKPADNTRLPVITLTVNTAASMNASSLLLRNNLFVMEDGGTVRSNGDYHIADSLDLDGDGNLTELYGRLAYSNQIGITITPNTNQLEFTAHAKISGESDSAYRNGTSADNRLYISSASDNIDYRLTLGNNSGSIVPAGNFMYYIPIPRANLTGHMITNAQFDLVLLNAVTITGTNPTIYDVRYSTDATGDNYDNGKADFSATTGQATWQTASQINTNWQAVTMIKIIAADPVNGHIPTETVDYFNLSLGYNGTIDVNAGKTTSWGCCGVQKYTREGELSEGTHTPTDFVVAMLRSVTSASQTLTAAQGTPSGINATKTATFTLPAFYDAKNISILSITTSNVVLHTTATINANRATAVGSTANGSFALTLTLDSGTNTELANGTNQILGATTANTASTLTVVLDNYNALNDVSTPRSVTVIIGNTDGVQFTITLNISREAAIVTTVLTHIQSGRTFQQMHGNDADTEITCDSAFTAQYALSYAPANCTAHVLTLLLSGSATNFPVGTTLILIDVSQASSPHYYSHTVSVATTNIALTDFNNMSDQTAYADAAQGSGTQEVEETLLLIVDFAAASLPQGNYTIRMSLDGGTTNNDLLFTASAQRSFTLTATLDNNNVSTTLSVGGTASTTTDSVGDSRWLYRKMALVISLKDGDGAAIAFPTGTTASMNGELYLPSGDVIILPLGSLGEYTYAFTINTPHTKLAEGNYTLCTSLYVSATASADSPMGGDQTASADSNFSVSHASHYVLNVTTQNEQQLIAYGDATALNVVIYYDQLTANAAITVELQEKVDNTYLTRDNIITGANVGETSYIVNGYGVIQLPTRPYGEGNIVVTLALNRSNLTVGHTYRIHVKAVGVYGTTDDVYNFILIE